MLTDGTIIFTESANTNWWKLTPDEFGSYENGTFSRIASTANYAPLYFSSATLPDGRVIVEGGEYDAYNPVWTTKGAIYDPVADKWQAVAPPAGWSTIGDASSYVLPTGQFLLTDCCTTTGMALLDPATLTWKTNVGTGKADIHDEESWAELNDGRIITVDANNNFDHGELYDWQAQTWSSAGPTPVHIADTSLQSQTSHEVGPEILRPDGTVVVIGGTNHNAIFDSKTETWSVLPDTPGGAAATDGPGAILPNGDVIYAASTVQAEPDVFGVPTHFFQVTPDNQLTMLDPVATMEPTDEQSESSYQNAFIMLPTGELLASLQSPNMYLYTPAPGVMPEAVPEILAAPTLIGTGPEAPTGSTLTIYRGRTYTLPVARMNGINWGAYYGDDAQSSTNFPLVRLTNQTTKHVKYARTHDHSDRSIALDQKGTTQLDIPESAEPGIATLEVVVNGIASAPITVNVK